MSEAREREPGVDPGEATVGALWDASSRRLRAWFERRTGSAQDADDLLQETFLRVQSGLGRVRRRESLHGWVGAIAGNVLADHRRTRARAAAPAALAALAALAVGEDEPARADRDEDDGAGLRRAAASWAEAFLARLEPEEAALLRAVDLEGRPQTGVARELGLPPSTVRARVQRARTRLRRELEACCRFAFDARGNLTGTERRERSRCDCEP